jgi:hypothetical protein
VYLWSLYVSVSLKLPALHSYIVQSKFLCCNTISQSITHTHVTSFINLNVTIKLFHKVRYISKPFLIISSCIQVCIGSILKDRHTFDIKRALTLWYISFKGCSCGHQSVIYMYDVSSVYFNYTWISRVHGL